MKGKLVIIESGSDASGKATQAKLLLKRLAAEKYNVMKVEFPDYERDSSALVKMYLRGDFGKNPGDVNPYASSTFFAVDRFASYKTRWQDFYLQGGIVLADRYTTSNMVHQAAKFTDAAERESYLQWLWHFEFVLFQLPQPDIVFFLDMPPAYCRQIIKDRNNKITGEAQKDIHESSASYLEESYKTALYIAKKYCWRKIDCVKNNELRTIEDIHNDIYIEMAKDLLPPV